MNKHTATICFQTTDKATKCCLEALLANILDGHGLEVTDIHVEDDDDAIAYKALQNCDDARLDDRQQENEQRIQSETDSL